MTKEEQLRIYSAYLPYGLQFYPSENSDLFHDLYADNFPHTTLNYQLALQDKDPDAIKISKSYLKQKSPFICFEDGELFLGQFESSLGFDIDDVFASEVKPILYDLSYLTKEIEHEGEMIILQDKMPHLDFEWLIGNPKLAFKLNQEDFEILVKHHFNVFNLSESEYINKATLCSTSK